MGEAVFFAGLRREEIRTTIPDVDSDAEAAAGNVSESRRGGLRQGNRKGRCGIQGCE
jgi:hypothetical protein